MGTYLFKASYTVEGIRGILEQGGSAPLRAIKKLVSSLGGKTVCAYWAFGDRDFLLIAELPDNATAAALGSRVSASGIAGISTTVLLSAEDIDAACGVTVNYTPPRRVVASGISRSGEPAIPSEILGA